MTNEEMAMLLAKIQVLDNRQVDEVTFAAWKEVLGDLEYEFAAESVVKHFRESTEYLKPAHVVARARDLRRQANGEAQQALDKWRREQYGDDVLYGYGPERNARSIVAALHDPRQVAAATAEQDALVEQMGYGRRIPAERRRAVS